ncbi:hypothetical protein [Serratia symbiotica]|uniref:hypothetical protein n=1 Tax=Serratia symbiotica TaxID=138074 RepID=UPI003CC864A1
MGVNMIYVANKNGRLESADALTLHTRTLDNQASTLFGLQALTLTAQQDYTRCC